MTWTTINLEVTTPLFNGGAGAEDKAQADAGFRISSLRGAMRFWFRALAGIGIGSNTAALATVESHVFGTTDHASPVRLRLLGQPPTTRPGQPVWCRGEDGRWIVYLLGQGLGDLRKCTVSRPYIEAGTPITIQARLGDNEDLATLVLASLWLTCTFGGLGARTRRGFGGLRIVNVNGDLAGPWTAETLRTPGLDFYQPLRCLWPAGPLNACMKTLMAVATGESCKVPFSLAAADAPPASYPVFSRTRTLAGLSGGEAFVSWQQLLGYTGRQLRHFRASRPAPEVERRYRPAVKTPEWLDVVHGSDQHFGLGALGLPVIYKDGYSVNAYGRNGTESLRRASPLWLRPVGGGRDWRLLSFAFHNEFLPDTVQVELRQRSGQSRRLTVDNGDVVDRTTRWITNLREDIDLSST
ncbi:MAG: type III-B CRISPR module RAMP protein Cmr1 [Micromonosporaceae bacterium]|nr:type III-B CRISPR module RAMP protein Cmr1 [Micromonosporaceae bacterium]